MQTCTTEAWLRIVDKKEGRRSWALGRAFKRAVLQADKAVAASEPREIQLLPAGVPPQTLAHAARPQYL